jgi:hypothetical protein
MKNPPSNTNICNCGHPKNDHQQADCDSYCLATCCICWAYVAAKESDNIPKPKPKPKVPALLCVRGGKPL